ncbi:glycosyltransferase family 4 protein [Mucilaginibacter lutimaris]|uniref:Glycosyltransferase family 4 protein n=1 Tax=Mucilaginibacter lutimaris TaxID=931629 RepID=A0ABW2ZCQ9_9SPHI
MKILLTSYYYKPHFGGIENSLFYLAQTYKQQGHEVLIVASDSGPADSRLPAEEVIDNIKVKRFRSYNPKISALKILKFYNEVKACASFFKQLNFLPDVVVTRNHITGYAAVKAGFKNIVYIIPGVVKIQDRGFAGIKSSSYFVKKLKDIVVSYVFMKYLEGIQVELLNACKKIIVFSKNMGEQVLSVAPASKDKIVIAQPGIDTNYFANLPGKDEARRQIGIDKDKFVYLILSRLVRQKAIDIAIRAFKAIDHTNAILLIVGDGPEGSTLKQLAADLELTDKVLFMGKTLTPNIFYTLADVYLLPSVHETFGQTIIEALFAGKPVVAFDSNQPGIKTASSEIIDSGSGILTQYNIEAYAAAMAEIRSNYAAYQINKQVVADTYSWNKLAEAVING